MSNDLSDIPGGGTCFAADCGEHIPEGMLMCRRHWFRVPDYIRRMVWADLRAYERGDAGALERLRASQQAAREKAR